MKFFEIELPVVTPGKSDYTAHMTAYIPSNGLDLAVNKSRPAVVIFPGGGYHTTYPGEAEPIALAFTAEGAAAFVVWYSVTAHCPNRPPHYPQALIEGLTAVRWVRSHAEQYGIDLHNIAALGFSAGGHLAACCGTLWKRPELAPYLPAPRGEYRPDKLILCYAAIRCFPPEEGNDRAVLREALAQLVDVPPDRLDARAAELPPLALDAQVDSDTPPCFIWHTWSDPVVPVQSALAFAQALADRHVACELHVYPHGGHGLCLANHVTQDACPYDRPLDAAEWTAHAVSFLFDAAPRPEQ